MKTVFFYILFGQCYATEFYEKPPKGALVSGTAIAVPHKACKQEQGSFFDPKKDTTYVMGSRTGWAKLKKIKLESKKVAPNF